MNVAAPSQMAVPIRPTAAVAPAAGSSSGAADATDHAVARARTDAARFQGAVNDIKVLRADLTATRTAALSAQEHAGGPDAARRAIERMGNRLSVALSAKLGGRAFRGAIDADAPAGENLLNVLDVSLSRGGTVAVRSAGTTALPSRAAALAASSDASPAAAPADLVPAAPPAGSGTTPPVQGGGSNPPAGGPGGGTPTPPAVPPGRVISDLAHSAIDLVKHGGAAAAAQQAIAAYHKAATLSHSHRR